MRRGGTWCKETMSDYAKWLWAVVSKAPIYYTKLKLCLYSQSFFVEGEKQPKGRNGSAFDSQIAAIPWRNQKEDDDKL